VSKKNTTGDNLFFWEVLRVARWVQVLKDGDWAMVRAEAIDSFWITERKDEKVVNFDVNGQTYYLLYPRKRLVPDISDIRKWLDVDYDGVLTLWHFYVLPTRYDVTEFVVSVALTDYLHSFSNFKSFKNREVVRQGVEEALEEISERGEALDFGFTLPLFGPGWWEDLTFPKSLLLEEWNGFKLVLKSHFVQIIPKLQGEEKISDIADRIAGTIVNYYNLVNFVKRKYPKFWIL
jgi:hypothetical protein